MGFALRKDPEYERVAHLLQKTAVEQPDGTRLIVDLISQAEIARRVGSSRDMVNRIFKALMIGNYLRLDDGHIVLLQKTLPRAF